MLVTDTKIVKGEAKVHKEDIINMVRAHLTSKGKTSRITNIRVSFDIPSGGDYSGMNYEFESDDLITVSYDIEE